MTSKAPTSQSAPQTDTSEPDPSSTSTSWIEQPETVRRLQILVVALGAVLVIGFATVIGRIAYLALQPAQPPVASSGSKAKPGEANKVTAPAKSAEPTNAEANPVTDIVIPLPQGANVKAITPLSDGLLVHIETVGGTEALVIDRKTGAVKSRFRFKPAQ